MVGPPGPAAGAAGPRRGAFHFIINIYSVLRLKLACLFFRKKNGLRAGAGHLDAPLRCLGAGTRGGEAGRGAAPGAGTYQGVHGFLGIYDAVIYGDVFQVARVVVRAAGGGRRSGATEKDGRSRPRARGARRFVKKRPRAGPPLPEGRGKARGGCVGPRGAGPGGGGAGWGNGGRGGSGGSGRRAAGGREGPRGLGAGRWGAWVGRRKAARAGGRGAAGRPCPCRAPSRRGGGPPRRGGGG